MCVDVLQSFLSPSLSPFSHVEEERSISISISIRQQKKLNVYIIHMCMYMRVEIFFIHMKISSVNRHPQISSFRLHISIIASWRASDKSSCTSELCSIQFRNLDYTSQNLASQTFVSLLPQKKTKTTRSKDNADNNICFSNIQTKISKLTPSQRTFHDFAAVVRSRRAGGVFFCQVKKSKIKKN